MSKGALAASLHKSITGRLKEYNALSGDKAQRVILDKDMGAIIFSASSIQHSAKYEFAGSKAKLSRQQAQILFDIAIQTFSHLKEIDPIKQIAKAKEHATKNKRTGNGSSGIFTAKRTQEGKNRAKYLIRIKGSGKETSRDTLVVYANKFDKIRKFATKPFSEAVEAFVTGETPQAGGHTLDEFINAGSLNLSKTSDLYGTSDTGTNLDVGHTDALGGKTIQRASISLALKKTTTSMIEDKSELQRLLKRIDEDSERAYRGLHLGFSGTHTKKTSNLNKLVNTLKVMIYLPHPGKVNQNALSDAETRIGKHFTSEKYIQKLIDDMNIIHQESSPAWITGVFKTLTDFFMKDIKKLSTKVFRVKTPKTSKGKNTATSVKGQVRFPEPLARKLLSEGEARLDRDMPKLAEPILDIVIPERPKTKKSCMLSTQQLLALTGRLNSSIEGMIKSHMKRPALVYRTGRFASSVKIDSVLQTPDCTIVPKFSYMTRPYAVFDPSMSIYRGLSSPTRNPRKIIGDSIRALAIQVIKDKYTITPQWSGG